MVSARQEWVRESVGAGDFPTEQGSGMIRIWIASLARLASLALAPAATQAKPTVQLRPPPRAAAWTYRYEARETVGDTVGGYSVDYRLKIDRSGRMTALVLKAETIDHQTAIPVTIDPDCAEALGARPGEMAEIVLYPLTPERAKLGDAFMAACAPKAVFFSMTDILNVTLVQAANTFHLDRLRDPGDTFDFDGFNTRFDRLGMNLAETSDGGRITFADLKGGRAVIDWAPRPLGFSSSTVKAAAR